jgi:hypothetical protein
MKNVLNKMIEQLSGEDKVIFSQLAEKLNAVDGDISKLSKQEFELIAQMETRYADKLSQFSDELGSEEKPATSWDILQSGFASYVRQILARDLKEQFPNEEDAVKFVFQNKWLPEDFRNPDTVMQIYENYKQDIGDANQWREDVVGVESDKSMAVGMTWFMVVYQLNERLN